MKVYTTFTFTDFEREYLEHAFELFLKQERRAENQVMAKRVADMLDVIRDAKPNTDNLFSLSLTNEQVPIYWFSDDDDIESYLDHTIPFFDVSIFINNPENIRKFEDIKADVETNKLLEDLSKTGAVEIMVAEDHHHEQIDITAYFDKEELAQKCARTHAGCSYSAPTGDLFKIWSMAPKEEEPVS
jgi:hypothetical protein